jgi:hypothetical protein
MGDRQPPRAVEQAEHHVVGVAEGDGGDGDAAERVPGR